MPALPNDFMVTALFIQGVGMAKIGKWYYPEITVEKAIKYARTVYESLGHTLSIQELANKEKIKGERVGQIIDSLRAYGLIKRDDDELKTTSLAEKCLNPDLIDESGLRKTRKTLLLNIPLWKRIYSGYREKVTKGSFLKYLKDQLKIKTSEIRKNVGRIQRLYLRALEYCSTEPTPTRAEYAEYKSKRIYLRAIQTRGTIDELRGILNLWEKRLKSEGKPKKGKK